MAAALDLGSSARKGVRVRISLPAHFLIFSPCLLMEQGSLSLPRPPIPEPQLPVTRNRNFPHIRRAHTLGLGGLLPVIFVITDLLRGKFHGEYCA